VVKVGQFFSTSILPSRSKNNSEAKGSPEPLVLMVMGSLVPPM